MHRYQIVFLFLLVLHGCGGSSNKIESNSSDKNITFPDKNTTFPDKNITIPDKNETNETIVENNDTDNDGLADRYEKEFGLVVGIKDADDETLDPLYAYQWHLSNLGHTSEANTDTLEAHEDINIKPVWKDTLGHPDIVVSVVDTGVEANHTDLQVDFNSSYRYSDNSHDPSVTSSQLYKDKEGSAHGTACAGIIAAKGWNSQGVRGIAPKVTLAGLNVFSAPSDANFADALQRMDVDVSSNSWGGGGAYWLFDDITSLQAIENSIVNGRDGKGIVYIFASGNDRANANFQSILTSGYVVAVSAVNGAGEFEAYSDFGANILVSAPGGAKSSSGEPAIVSTDLSGLKYGFDHYREHWDVSGNDNGDYTSVMNGTSASCPMVSGVASLMLSVNPELTYRDIQYLLATTARKVDVDDDSWMTNASAYKVSDKYGFGVIDAAAAVKKASKFISLGEELNVTKSLDGNYSITSEKSVSLALEVPTSFKMMLVQATVWIEHNNPGKLKIILESPSGTKSVLAYGDTVLYDSYTPWTFSSVQMLDESSEGRWHLHIDDRGEGNSGALTKWELTLKGYKK